MSLFGAKEKKEIEVLRKNLQIVQQELSFTKSKMDELGITDYLQAQGMTNRLTEENNELQNKQILLRNSIEELTENVEKTEKQLSSQIRKLSRNKELYKSMEYSVNSFSNDTSTYNSLLSRGEVEEIEAIAPSVILKLHSMDVKDLRKAYRENEKNIDKILISYSSRYTTKANKTIYDLMILALRAELQNILYNLKYEKLDTSVDTLKSMTAKYLSICSDGNQSIASTMKKFIGEIEYLFINSIKIEYNYYVRKEQAKQEQLALRQQMREETEERKQLEQQQKQIEKEEQKYHAELLKVKEMLLTSDDSKTLEFNARILELEAQLSDVLIKKDEIVKLQNGKAGSVYVISNLGAFGDNTFKVGMTRRLDPIDRINELGNASVPFRFDIHSLIFSDDAVALEKKLHDILNDKRINKVNLRKEFFSTTVDDLEQLVTDIEPTAEFNKTMLAEEFRQSTSTDTVYGDTEAFFDDEDEYEE